MIGGRNLRQIILTGVAFCAAPVFALAWSIEWAPAGAAPAVEFGGVPAGLLKSAGTDARLPEALAAMVSVRVDGSADTPGLSGTWSVRGDRLRFEPRFPWTAGVRYRAEVRPAGGAPLVSYFEPPALAAGATTAVAAVFPSARVLPENQLKFYLQFSGAMSRGDVYRHIHLRDAAGQPVERPFLELDEELWDPGLTRLTVLVDPGRIKRGVKPLEDMGPVFEEGKRYSLTIDAAWLDAAGRPLRGEFRKEFVVGPADRTPPDPVRWKIEAPKAGTRGSLVVTFDEPMDHALALRMIGVVARDGARVPFTSAVSAEDRRLECTPEAPWAPGTFYLVVPTTIEDLAGNNVGKVFDVDLFERVERHITTETVKVPFEVK